MHILLSFLTPRPRTRTIGMKRQLQFRRIGRRRRRRRARKRGGNTRGAGRRRAIVGGGVVEILELGFVGRFLAEFGDAGGLVD